MSSPAPLPASPSPAQPSLRRQCAAEAVGTGTLVAIIVGSGIAASRLYPGDAGAQLLANSLATALGLAVLIVVLQPVSGAHLNPVVTLVDRLLGARRSARAGAVFVAAQVIGALAGAILANAMFAVPTAISATQRISPATFVAEVVATAGLVVVVFGLVRTGRAQLVGPAVGAYIGAAIWFTSSTAFANPAVTVGRIVTDTFAGIAPGSGLWFVAAQLVGAALALVLVRVLFPVRQER